MKRLVKRLAKNSKKTGAAGQQSKLVSMHQGSATVKNNKQAQQVRIIAGHCRGRKLPVALVNGLRPSNDRVRETLFNWLAPVLPNSQCLDMFAGSGALGFEALSRGAKRVDMVELSQVASLQLQQNLATLPLQAHQMGYVHQMSCFDWLRQQAQTDQHILRYDIVFIDPPFALDLVAEALIQLDKAQVLSPQARIYVENASSIKELTLPAGWQVHKHKKAGQVHYGLLDRLS